jgi:hypothetical protein
MDGTTYSFTILDLDTRYRWVVSFTHWQLYPRANSPTIPICHDTGWAPEAVWTRQSTEESLALLEIEPRTCSMQLVTLLLRLNPVDWVSERTILTERPQLVDEVSANFCA